MEQPHIRVRKRNDPKLSQQSPSAMTFTTVVVKFAQRLGSAEHAAPHRFLFGSSYRLLFLLGIGSSLAPAGFRNGQGIKWMFVFVELDRHAAVEPSPVH